ncbi:hypothetical protein FRC00_014108 [Tulasnella sp. 408]|nr:hypothetical protein FRC00_014108 [Tulasnella sp. 408]
MVSLFGRSRTSSKNTSALPAGPSKSGYDEFGRGQSGEGAGGQWLTAPDEGKAGGGGSRKRTLSAPGPPHLPSAYGDLPPVPHHQEAFVPLHIPPKKESDSQERDYGYLSAENEVILSLEDVQRLVRVVGDEILSRAVTTPLLFSSQALDVSANRVRSLVRSFLGSCQRPSAPTGDAKWREDAKLAGPHELGMVLRWGLARLMRVVNGVYVRGMLEWDVYVQWKSDEQALRFPATHFPVFLDMVSPALRPLLSQLFNIFSRLAAYSAQSGLTPIAISTLFGPLLFGLGPDSIPFSQTYAAYLRSSHATEHLLLSYIRNVEVEARHSASPMPLRLKDWIRGYPVMIPPLKDLEKPRRGCRLVKVVSARRNVRLYSSDLVRTGASWGNEGDIGGRREWQRIGSKTMPPKYAEDYRKRLDIPVGQAPSLSSFSTRSSLDYHAGTVSTPPSSMASRSISFGLTLEDGSGSKTSTEDLAPKPFKSLTDMRWGEFEDMGFSDPDMSKLQFDLNEASRTKSTTKRTTMSWNDFHDIGFLRDDSNLADTLQFSTPLSSTISTWPSHAEEIHRKLKKTQKTLPTFGWDTSPVAGPEWTIEEGFIEFKALPLNPNDAPPETSLVPSVDPRTSSQYFLFEEFVPREYREELLSPPKKGVKGGLFATPKKEKKWKPATTLNGKPYNGRPRSPDSRKEAEFDAMLKGSGTKTRILGPERSQTMPDARRAGIPPSNSFSVTSRPGGAFPASSFGEGAGRGRQLSFPTTADEAGIRRDISPAVPPKDKTSSPLARFKIGSSKGKQSKVASQYDPDLDFETKTASDSSGGEQSPGAMLVAGGHGRRHSKDDAWVDILVGSNRRMPDQEATMRNGIRAMSGGATSPERGYQPAVTTVVPNGSGSLRTPRTSLNRPRSDPELGRDEIASGYQALVDQRRDHTYGSQAASSAAMRPVSYDDDISYAESDEEEVMEVPRHSVIDGPQIRVSQSSDGPPPVQPSSRGYSYGDYEDEADFEPAMSPVSTERALADEQDSYHAQSQQLPAPPQAIPAQDRVATVEPKPRVAVARKPGGINSLIEMYAKKDEEAAKAHYEPKASRLPVRTGSTGATSPSNLKASEGSPDRTPSPVEFAPPPPMEDPINRLITPSPARYVHGAPLHNVIEEDGEEMTEEA